MVTECSSKIALRKESIQYAAAAVQYVEDTSY